MKPTLLLLSIICAVATAVPTNSRHGSEEASLTASLNLKAFFDHLAGTPAQKRDNDGISVLSHPNVETGNFLDDLDVDVMDRRDEGTEVSVLDSAEVQIDGVGLGEVEVLDDCLDKRGDLDVDVLECHRE